MSHKADKNSPERPSNPESDLDETIKKTMEEAEAAVSSLHGDEEDVAAQESTEAALEQEVEQLRDKWLRAVADNENLKKRMRRDAGDSKQRALQSLLGDFLPVADNLERAMEAAQGNEQIIQGIKMVTQVFMGALAKHGITPVDAVGQPFDPAIHDALQQFDSPDHAPGAIIQEFEKGFVRDGRLIRPARVIVAGSGSTGAAKAPVTHRTRPTRSSRCCARNVARSPPGSTLRQSL